MATTTTSAIDPTIQPYLTYGLQQAQQAYQGGGPQYYGGQTYVSPSTTTQTGLQALEARAKLGNPLLQSAQNQLQNTVSLTILAIECFAVVSAMLLAYHHDMLADQLASLEQ